MADLGQLYGPRNVLVALVLEVLFQAANALHQRRLVAFLFPLNLVDFAVNLPHNVDRQLGTNNVELVHSLLHSFQTPVALFGILRQIDLVHLPVLQCRFELSRQFGYHFVNFLLHLCHYPLWFYLFLYFLVYFFQYLVRNPFHSSADLLLHIKNDFFDVNSFTI